MKKVILASNNSHKLEEMKKILSDFNYEVVTMEEAGLINFEIVEDGKTFEENSLIKAKAVLEKLGEPTIADDSGLMVDYLDGEPGVYSARYAGKNVSYEDNNKKLLGVLEEVPFLERKAKFVSVITMLFPSGDEIVVRGEIKGNIALMESGENGFGYDPLFYISELKKTFAELSSEEKNEISHRAKALKILKEKLNQRNE
ncbi:MAG: XTP/dITP diphosphatase [Clostridiales bacterium]|nr:XTP/dITP diphosphatase [Clostridiales bacterium]